MATSGENRRSQIQTASGLNCLAAIWLFISAFAVFGHGAMVTNNVIFAVIVFILAAIRFGGAYEMGGLSWINALIGLWVIISPWAVLGNQALTSGMIANNCITGGVLLVLGVWSALATTSPESDLSYSNGPRPSLGR